MMSKEELKEIKESLDMREKSILSSPKEYRKWSNYICLKSFEWLKQCISTIEENEQRLKDELETAYNAYEKLQNEYERLDELAAKDVEENEQLRKELERLKGIEELLDSANNAIEPLNDELEYERKENEQLRKQLEKATNERNTFRDYLAISVQALSVIEETLGKQKIMDDARLRSVYTKICEALLKTL